MSFTKKIRNYFNILFFGKDSEKTLGLLRMLIGFSAFLRFTSSPRYYSYSDFFKSFPVHTFSSENEYFLDAYAHPLLPLPVPSFELYASLETLGLILSVFLVLGFLTKVSGNILGILIAYDIIISQFFANHYFYLLAIAILFIVNANSNKYLSLDKFLFAFPTVNSKSISTLKSIGILVSSIYFFAAIGKLTNPSWRNGEIIVLFKDYNILNSEILTIFLNYLPPIFISSSVIFTLLFLSVGLWFKKTKYISLILATIFHISIGLLTGIWIFGLLMISLCIVFLRK